MTRPRPTPRVSEERLAETLAELGRDFLCSREESLALDLRDARAEAARWKAVADELAGALRPLIDTAESHAMQTYDRGGVTGQKINEANAALARYDAAVKESE